MSVKRLLIFVILMSICAAVTFFFYGYGTEILTEQAIADAGEEYMTAIQVGDYNAAFGLTDPAFQSQIVDPPGLQNLLVSWSFFPATWNFHERRIESGVGHLQGSVRLTDGRNMGVELEFVEVQGNWRVSRMEFINT